MARVALWGGSRFEAAEANCNAIWRLDYWGINLQERVRRIVYAIRVAVNRYFSAKVGSKMSYRRRQLEAIRTDVRGERTPWSEEHLVASAIWSREDPPFSGHRLPILHQHLLQVWYCADFKMGV